MGLSKIFPFKASGFRAVQWVWAGLDRLRAALTDKAFLEGGKGVSKSSAWRQISITNQRGLKLAALLTVPEAGGEADSCGGDQGQEKVAAFPLVISCHGFTGTKEGGGRALEMGEALREFGYATLLFDFTGCGESEGAWEEISLSRQIDDLAAVVEWCRGQGYTRIVLNGRSFGGTTVLCYAAGDREVAAVSTWAAAARPGTLFTGFAGVEVDGPPQDLVALVEGEATVYVRKAFFYDLQRHNPLQCAAGLAPRPLQLIHGTADEVVPVDDARLLYHAATEPKELALIEGADHRFSAHMDTVWQTFFTWLQRLSPPGKS